MPRELVETYHDQTARDFDCSHDTDPYYSKIYEPLARDNLRLFLPARPCRILDAGGGTGRWSLWLAGLGHTVVLTDLSTEMVEVAREKARAAGFEGQIQVLRCDICAMSALADNQFDVSMAQGDPVSYCASPQRALAELARVTRPGGHVIISVDGRIKAVKAMAELDWSRAKAILAAGEMAATNPLNIPFRLHAFTVGELRLMFAENGLRVVRVLGIPVFFPLLPSGVQKQILESPADLASYLSLERDFADDPGWAGAANHIQVVGIKVRS